MSLPALVPDHPDDVERLGRVTDAFVFSAPEPVWAPLTSERPRAAARLLAFVTAVGIGGGLVVWIAAELLVAAVRATF
jgi:hypothetical protein